MKGYDITMNTDGTFNLKNGDFYSINSEQEHAYAIILSNKNDWKEFPSIGVGVAQFLNGNSSDNYIINKEANEQLKSDGFIIQNIKLDFSLSTSKLDLKINAKREQ